MTINADLARVLAEEAGPIVAGRLRLAILVAFAVTAVYAVVDLLLGSGDVSAVHWVQAAEAIFLLLLWAALDRSRARNHPSALAVALTCSIYAAGAAAGAVAGNAETTATLFAAVSLVSAALFPWSYAAQAFTLLVAASAMAVNLVWISDNPLSVLEPPTVVAVAIGFVGSLLVLYVSKRGREELMRERLRARGAEHDARARESSLRIVTEGIPAILWTTDSDLRVEQVSGALAANVGLGGGDSVMSIGEYLAGAQPDSPLVQAQRRALKGNTVSLDFSLGSRSYHGYLEPARDFHGDVVGVVGIALDITLRKKAEDEVRRLNSSLEQRVGERTTELQTAVRELESFSQAVSHDLRQPLRTINGFLHLLEEDLDSSLEPRTRDYLQRARSGAERMGGLIDDLLQLSRVSGATLERKEVDLSAMAASIASVLHAGAPDRNVVFKIKDGMIARGDAGLLNVLLRNLIENAWKFTSRQPRAHIEVTRFESPSGEKVYAVRDDGVGFDQAFAHKLFGTFHRLHAWEEYEGTGIGLATVERIVRRHGGKVWGEGVLGRGATFFFTLGEA